MEELLEMITWCQLGIHDKPVSSTLTHIHWTDRCIHMVTEQISSILFSNKVRRLTGRLAECRWLLRPADRPV
jgi:predicted Rossmann-fold nucleotide-binding protein